MGWSRRVTGLTSYAPDRALAGYTLFAPNGGDDAYLVDMKGFFVHRWHCDQGIGHGYLLPNGNLLLRNPASAGPAGFPGPQNAEGIQELDWDGNLIWEYRNPDVRRFQRLANGNTLLLLREDISVERTRQVKGGFITPTDPEAMSGDLVIEITPECSTVFEWRSADHLKVEEDVICPLEGRTAWGSANDIAALDNGDFLISFRVLDTIVMVDRSSGGVLWKWGRGEISHQHHPTPLPNGRVLLLDNGAHRRGLSYSRVLEVDPATDEVVWDYHGDPLSSFFTHFTGGAERLVNGNTLISEGYEGRLFEVTPKGEVVWEYISPFFRRDREGSANRVFRAHRYDPDHPALSGRDLDPARYANLNRLYSGTHQ